MDQQYRTLASAESPELTQYTIQRVNQAVACAEYSCQDVRDQKLQRCAATRTIVLCWWPIRFQSTGQFLQFPVGADKVIDRLVHLLGFSRPFPMLPRRMAWPRNVPTSSPVHATNAPTLNGGCPTPPASGLCRCCAPGRIKESLRRVHEVVVTFCHPTAPRFEHCRRLPDRLL